MTAKVIQLSDWKNRTMKKIDPNLLKLMMKHHKLIAQKRKAGFSAVAIAKAVMAAEDSRRS